MKNIICSFIVLSLPVLVFPTAYAQTENDLLDTFYKDSFIPLISSYKDILYEIEFAVPTSSYELSGFELESYEAKREIDKALDLRLQALELNLEKARVELEQLEYFLENGSYQQAYGKFYDLEQYLVYAKNDLTSVLIKIKDAKELEKKYQEENPSCFLFWCDVKNTWSILDSKIQNLESKTDILKIKLEKLKLERESAKKSLESQLTIIENKNKEIQRLENKQKQDEIDKAKAKYRSLGKDYPIFRGIANGDRLNFWVEPLPDYVSEGVRTKVDSLISYFDNNWFNGINLHHTTSRNHADFTINWVTDYNPNHNGRQVGDHLLVGLGSSSQCGSWKPYDGLSVYRIMYHEVGHALSQDHVSDENNIMYGGGLDKQYEYDHNEIVYVADGHVNTIPFCHDGDVYVSTEKINDSAGYEMYIVPPNTDAADFVSDGKGTYYPDCSGEYGQSWQSISKSCNGLPYGSKLLLYNPRDVGTGEIAQISLKIQEKNRLPDIDYTFRANDRYFTQTELDMARELFR